MTRLQGRGRYDNSPGGYARAEAEADMWAGDNQDYAVVTQEGENDGGLLWVMSYDDFQDNFLHEKPDAVIIYHANHLPPKEGS